MSAFHVYPAIDLRNGRCVRLRQGDPQREEIFGADPVAVARRWVADGAQALHVVDLDGAFAGEPRQLPLLRAIAAAVAVPVQFGGGLRRTEDVAAALDAGAERVVVGTRALERDFLEPLLGRWGPERVLVGLDARDDAVAVAGWRRTAGTSVGQAASLVRGWGATIAVHTQVRRDGMMAGPDLAGIGAVLARGLRVIASGGVTTTEDLATLAATAGVEGAIVGTALYAGRLTLGEALAAAASARR